MDELHFSVANNADGYEEAIIQRAGSSNSAEHLLYWRGGQPVLEPLLDESLVSP